MRVMSNATIPVIEQRHRLDIALDHAGVSVQEMADELGVSRNTVGNYLAGRTAPTKATLTVWALRTGVDANWLRYGVTVVEDRDPDPAAPATQDRRQPGWITSPQTRSFELIAA